MKKLDMLERDEFISELVYNDIIGRYRDHDNISDRELIVGMNLLDEGDSLDVDDDPTQYSDEAPDGTHMRPDVFEGKKAQIDSSRKVQNDKKEMEDSMDMTNVDPSTVCSKVNGRTILDNYIRARFIHDSDREEAYATANTILNLLISEMNLIHLNNDTVHAHIPEVRKKLPDCTGSNCDYDTLRNYDPIIRSIAEFVENDVCLTILQMKAEKLGLKILLDAALPKDFKENIEAKAEYTLICTLPYGPTRREV